MAGTQPTRQYFPGKVAIYHTWDDTWTANVKVTAATGRVDRDLG